MKKLPIFAVLFASIAFSVGIAPGAQAAAGDIGTFWNSGDQDASLRFISVGEHFKLCRGGTSAHVYFKWNTQSDGSGRVDAPSSLGQNQCKDYNMEFAEAHWVKAQVCEEKGGIVPDDCSTWKTGSS